MHCYKKIVKKNANVVELLEGRCIEGLMSHKGRVRWLAGWLAMADVGRAAHYTTFFETSEIILCALDPNNNKSFSVVS